MTDNTEALPPLPEEIEHAICAISPHLLALAKRWAANTVHSYQFANEAERLVRGAVRAAIAQRQQVPEGWQPIETAPRKDQMRALVAWPIDAGGHYVEEAWFDLARDQWWPANTDYTDSHGSPLYPSHWMPLPAAPALTAAPSAQAEPVAWQWRRLLGNPDVIEPFWTEWEFCSESQYQYALATPDHEARALCEAALPATQAARAEPKPCGQCRKADSWGIPLSKTCVYDCKFEPLNAAPPTAQAEPQVPKGGSHE